MPEIKAVMIGKFSVGKTSILTKFRSGTFTENTTKTIGVDFNALHFEHNTTDYYLQLWDTAGQEKYRSIARLYYKGAHIVFVTVSALDSASESIKSIQQALQNFDNMSSVRKVYIFVNKTDLVEIVRLKDDWNDHQAQISKMKIQNKLQDIFFVSAKYTTKEQFISIIQNAAIGTFAEDLEETVPSAIIAVQRRIDRKHQNNQGTPIRKEIKGTKRRKCCE